MTCILRFHEIFVENFENWQFIDASNITHQNSPLQYDNREASEHFQLSVLLIIGNACMLGSILLKRFTCFADNSLLNRTCWCGVTICIRSWTRNSRRKKSSLKKAFWSQAFELRTCQQYRNFYYKINFVFKLTKYQITNKFIDGTLLMHCKTQSQLPFVKECSKTINILGH